jgi:hypothetical protein
MGDRGRRHPIADAGFAENVGDVQCDVFGLMKGDSAI